MRLCLNGLVSDPAFVRFMERLGEEALRGFSTYDFLVLDHLHRDQPLTNVLRARVPRLVEIGAVESTGGRGKGARYILARRLYEVMGAKGVYTRKKGLDRGTNKALLLQHIQSNAAQGFKMKEFIQVLPALPRSQIQVLLRELAAEHAAHIIGIKNGARWFPGPGPTVCNPDDSVSNLAA